MLQYFLRELLLMKMSVVILEISQIFHITNNLSCVHQKRYTTCVPAKYRNVFHPSKTHPFLLLVKFKTLPKKTVFRVKLALKVVNPHISLVQKQFWENIISNDETMISQELTILGRQNLEKPTIISMTNISSLVL